MPVDESPPRLLHRRLVERAEAPAERHQVVVAQRLASKEEHLVLEPRLMDGGEGRGVERAEIDALHLGAQRSARRPDLNLLVHRGSLDTAGSRGTVAVGSMANEQTAPTSSSPAE